MKPYLKLLLIPIALVVFVFTRSDSPELTAVYSGHPVAFDAALSDPIWDKAPSYPLNVSWSTGARRLPLKESGSVKLAWDDHYLYVAASLHDADVVAEHDKDNVHHYATGDVLEVFLKPPGGHCYWELYATPTGRKSIFFYPSRGRVGLPSSLGADLDLKVAAKINGTLNHWQDTDQGWQVMMAIPLAEIIKAGGPLGAESASWSILVSRYNYSAYHDVVGAELSSVCPSRKNADFHRFENWAILNLVK